MASSTSPVARLWQLVQEEKKDITAIYIYSILNGIIQLSLPLGIQAIIGFVLSGSMSASLVLLISLMVAGVLLVGLLQVGQMRIIEKIQQKIFVKYSFAFADRIPKLDLLKSDGYYLPELVNRFFDTVSLQKSISKLLLDLPAATIQIILGLTLLAFYHPAFILFGILLLGILWLILRLTGHKGLKSSLAESSHKYAVAAWFEEMARVIKSFKFSSDSNLHIKKADEKTTHYLDARTEHFRILVLQYRALIAFKVAITASMLIVGVLLLLDNQINIGQFVAAEIIILTVINSVEKIIINLDSVYDALTSAEKLAKITDKPLESTGTFQLVPGNGISIQATNVDFGYDENAVIKNVSFNVAAGSKVAITGKEGSGKSTLLKLLTGVYPDFKGSLLYNDVPLGNYDLTSLRQRMGIFFLHENIFNGTLWENLTMGRIVDSSYLTHLMNITGLNSFLKTLPMGFDTELDPTGKKLPANVIHKILLIRALAAKPELLLLEDPWKGIELPNSNMIREFVMNIPNSTVLISTTDQACISNADHVISLS